LLRAVREDPCMNSPRRLLAVLLTNCDSLPRSTREQCQRTYPGAGLPAVTTDPSTPGPASYEIRRADADKVPTIIFGADKTHRRRRSAPAGLRRCAPAAPARVSTPGQCGVSSPRDHVFTPMRVMPELEGSLGMQAQAPTM
jgi:hypothetical protein